MEDYGRIIIHLEELIQASGLSKNKVSQRAEMQRTQLNNYCKNEVARVDLAVLARLQRTAFGFSITKFCIVTPWRSTVWAYSTR